ncbi:MAG: metabolite traffic protein EboE [Planctomycetota bacterium]
MTNSDHSSSYPSAFPFGYCTNVHAGTTLAQAKTNLLHFASPVAQSLSINGSLPLGLWLAEDAATALDAPGEAEAFRDWLRENHFSAYTLNGFPQGDFHQSVVKHAVYEPTWLSPSRLNYTFSLARVLSRLLPENALGSISTLPLGWPHFPWSEDDFAMAASKLLKLANELERLHHETGREIVVAIEPEPGCVLNTAPEIVQFFENYIFRSSDSKAARRYLSVCHDICHSGVMFEPQQEALASYLDAGIRVGKVQVSSAVHVPWENCSTAEESQAVLEQLQTFNEPKYLHQATRCGPNGRLKELCDDISFALQNWIRTTPEHNWRVHFHVPIFVLEFGSLATTQSDITEATAFLESNKAQQVADTNWFTGHYEVETYAWPVLPESLAANDLSEGITRELRHFQAILNSQHSKSEP